jgi:hypothetical protein
MNNYEIPHVHFTAVQLIPPPYVVLGGINVIVIAIGRKVRCFKSVQGRWIFKGDKNP